MKRPFKFFIIIFLAGILLCGCLTTQTPLPRIDYYILEYEPPVINLPGKLPCILRMERFQVAPLYNSTNIIYSENKFIRNAYNYHKWRSNPGDMITSSLIRDFRAAGLCNAVFMQGIPAHYSHVLQGVLDEFYEKDETNSRQAILTVAVTLINKNESDISKSILMQKQYHVSETCSSKSPVALADAMSRAMSKISGLIIQDIYKHLAKEL